jgi:DNA-binding NarL/FixJ family response regulator
MQILVVDDHVLIRDALRGVLNELRPDAIVLEASDCRQAMQSVAQCTDLELLLLDLGLPDADGFAMLEELREQYPSLPIVVLSALQDRNSVTRALDLGAVGFIPKSAQRAVMVSALHLVFAGGIYVPPEILRRAETPARQTQRSICDGRPLSPGDLGLTERQMEVLALMLRGKSNKAICRALELAEPTVKNHVTAVLRALRVTSRAEAIAVVNQLGWKLPAMIA